MSATDDHELLQLASDVLQSNDQGSYTAPAKDMYPHQWLWDSCFTAIGLRHLSVDRAKAELTSLLDGQWNNGMLPHMIFQHGAVRQRDWGVWKSELNPHAPSDVPTSGITQPPMLAEAVFRVGQKLSLPERRSWYKQMLPPLVKHHQWLYAERDPHQEGLVLLVHPWETGLDNTPPWMVHLHSRLIPWWVRGLQRIHAENLVGILRTDTKFVARSQRLSNVEAMLLYSLQRRLRHYRYDSADIMSAGSFMIEDLAFNCIMVRANQLLADMYQVIRHPLPDDLQASMARSQTALDKLWDDASGQYYPRDFISHHLLQEPTVATLLPLYAGCISQERAAKLVKLIENERQFGPAFPLPSVPVSSRHFDAERYWQGPTWVNMNWLVIDGLRRYGFDDYADALCESTLEMVASHAKTAGFAEYYNPQTGEPLGAKNFSWTAALAIDMLKS